MVAEVNLLAVLRAATTNAHARSESLLDNVADVRTDQGYQNYLKIMFRLYQAFGTTLDSACVAAGLSTRSEVLLSALGSELKVVPKTTPPACKLSDSWGAGVGYTLEGSALGAAVLIRRCRSSRTETEGAPFLSELSAGTRNRFKLYCDWLDAAQLEGEDAVAGALAVFESSLKAGSSLAQRSES